MKTLNRIRLFLLVSIVFLVWLNEILSGNGDDPVIKQERDNGIERVIRNEVPKNPTADNSAQAFNGILLD